MSAVRKFFLLIFIGGILTGFFYVVFFSSFFTVTKITIDKNGNVILNDVIVPFLDKLKGRNILFIKSDSLARELEQTFKNEILLVKIRKSYPHTVAVKIDEYPPILNLKISLPAKTQKLVINQIGYAIFDNAEIKGLPTLTFSNDKELRTQTVVIERSKLDYIAEAFKKFNELFAMRILYGEWNKIGRELRLKTEKNFEVWLDLTADIDRQLMKLKRALPRLDVYNEPLEYVDLRIAGGENEKVIFKRRR